MHQWFTQLNQVFPWFDFAQHPITCLLALFLTPLLMRVAAVKFFGHGNHPGRE